MSKGKILVVDDHIDNIQVIIKHLYPIGYEFIFSTSGKESIEMARLELPDLILLDIMMPGLSGFEVSRILSSESKTADIPIIFVTAMDDQLSILKAFENGGSDYITKPFNKEELKARVRTHIELKRSKDKLFKQNVELKDAVESKDHLLGMAAHDLKNPINGILGYTELLSIYTQDSCNEGINDAIDKIMMIAQKMEDLIRDTLSFNSIESGTINVDNKPFNLLDLFDEIIKLNTVLANRKGIDIRFIHDIKDDRFFGDQNKLDQILSNLISNSVKFSNSGTTIDIEITSTYPELRFFVKDEGLGISDDEKKLIFKPFTMTSTKSTGGENSTGLGLAIIKKLIDAMGGRVSFESKVGEGTTFFVAIPERS